jgi:protein-ribulosamine 3-kinase
MPDWRAMVEDIAVETGRRPDPDSSRPVAGGCINAGWRLESDEGPIFVKTNAPGTLHMFEAEREGLEELRAAETMQVPQPLATGATASEAWIAMEWIATGRPGPGTQARLGECLAGLHRRVAERFGWHRNNTIGSTPQPNVWATDWPSFLAEQRIGYQLELAVANGYGKRLSAPGGRLVDHIGSFFSDYQPAASLLHGDLWGGNWATDTAGEPFVFDPAVYFGDREADIAMTELFGGFGPDFRSAYQASWPLDPGYDTRRHLYNLYHVLNHLNLFGGGYLSQAESLILRLLATLGR